MLLGQAFTGELTGQAQGSRHAGCLSFVLGCPQERLTCKRHRLKHADGQLTSWLSTNKSTWSQCGRKERRRWPSSTWPMLLWAVALCSSMGSSLLWERWLTPSGLRSGSRGLSCPYRPGQSDAADSCAAMASWGGDRVAAQADIGLIAQLDLALIGEGVTASLAHILNLRSSRTGRVAGKHTSYAGNLLPGGRWR